MAERVVIRVGRDSSTLRDRWLGAGLREKRLAAGLTAVDAAGRLQRSHSTLSQWELGNAVADCSLLRVVERIDPIAGTGAKLLGAGGEGGSLLVVCPTDARQDVTEAAARAGCSILPVTFAGHGVRVRALGGAMA
jgi:transcriptional regulator with XRE-family HTH domain